jgi:alpha-amylase
VGSIPAAVDLGAGNGTNAGKDLSITFRKAGTYNLQVTVTDAGGKSATSQVQVQVQQTAQTVSVSPSTASILIGQSRTFTFGVQDQFGSPIASPQPATWSIVSSTANGSTIDASSGLFLAGASAGSATVQASVGGKSSTASITVTPGSSGTGVTPTPVDDSSSSGGCGTGVMLGLMLTSLTLLGLRRRNV